MSKTITPWPVPVGPFSKEVLKSITGSRYQVSKSLADREVYTGFIGCIREDGKRLFVYEAGLSPDDGESSHVRNTDLIMNAERPLKPGFRSRIKPEERDGLVAHRKIMKGGIQEAYNFFSSNITYKDPTTLETLSRLALGDTVAAQYADRLFKKVFKFNYFAVSEKYLDLITFSLVTPGQKAGLAVRR